MHSLLKDTIAKKLCCERKSQFYICVYIQWCRRPTDRLHLKFPFPAETDVLVPVLSQSTDVVVVNFVVVLKFPNFRPADRWNPKSQIIPKLGRILKFKPQPCYKLIKTLLQTENEGRVGYWAVATIFRFCSIFLCSASQRVQPTVGNSLLLSYTLHPNNTQIARTGNNNKCPAGWFYFLSLYHSKGQDNFQE